jgi:short-subunit dehydrogenase
MKVIWLIGASEGIGRSLATILKKEGHKLILSGRNESRLNELATELDATALPLDVTNDNSVQEAWGKCQDIDIVIYCAGYYKPLSAENFDLAETKQMIDVNLTGALRILSHVVPNFIKRKSGHIILIGSVAGYCGLPNAIGYGASKAGIIHLAENLKCDLTKHNIKVQVINPGFVKTRLTDLNKFHMPSIISSEEAANYIAYYMKGNSFESRFPFVFANTLKLISKLPYWIYFRIISNLVKD